MIRQQKRPPAIILTSNDFESDVKHNIKSTWTLDEYKKIVSSEEGRCRERIQTETPIPPNQRYNQPPCPYCASRTWLWLTQVALSNIESFPIGDEDIDSDEEDTPTIEPDEDVSVYCSFLGFSIF